MSRGYTSALARTAPVAPAVALPQGPIAAGFESTAIPIAVSTDFVDLPVTAEVWRARWPSQSVSLSSSTSPAKWAGDVGCYRNMGETERTPIRVWPSYCGK